jgi:hypothetical protein
MLTFNDSIHEYKIDGVKIPSVTQLIPKQDFSFVDSGTLEQARLEGIKLHSLAKMFFEMTKLNDEYEFPRTDFFFDIELFWLENKSKFGAIESIETPMVHESKLYAGTPDLVCKNAIVDFKRTISDEKIHALQCAGYESLVEEKKYWFVYEFSTGKWKDITNHKARKLFPKLIKKYYIEQEIKNYMENLK